MPAANALHVLLDHDRWATEQLLEAAAPLTDAQLDRYFDIGHGSLRKTIAHMLDVMADWQASLQSGEAKPLPETSSIADLKSAHDRIANDFASFVDKVESLPNLHAEKRGKKIDIPPQAILTHILTHGMHHRAQALNMLRSLGLPQPPNSVMQWAVATNVAHLE